MLNFIKIILKNLFNIKDKNYYAPLQTEIEEKVTVPTWEEVVEKCYGQEVSLIPNYTVEKVIYTKTKDFRVIIYKKKDMYFTIYERLYAWDEDELQYGCNLPGYWCPTGENTSVFDSIKTAEREIYSMPQFKEQKYKIYHRGYANIDEMYDDFKDYIDTIKLEDNKIFIEHNSDVLVIEKSPNGFYYTYRNSEKKKATGTTKIY